MNLLAPNHRDDGPLPAVLVSRLPQLQPGRALVRRLERLFQQSPEAGKARDYLVVRRDFRACRLVLLGRHARMNFRLSPALPFQLVRRGGIGGRDISPCECVAR